MIRCFVFIACFGVFSCKKANEVIEAAVIPPSLKYSEISPGKIAFSVTGTNIIGYNWDFGDRTTNVTEAAPFHQFNFNGEYKVVLNLQIKIREVVTSKLLTEVITIKALPTATPNFNIIPDPDNKTISTSNPSKYIKSVDWEFIDSYDGVTKYSGQNAKHVFKWNGEHKIKMTAKVEAAKGDTTYTDLQTIKITGNPPPEIVIGLMGHTGDRSSVFVRMDRFSKIHANMGDGNYAVGSVDIGNNKVSDKPFDGAFEYNFPYNGIFKAEITMVNPNGTTTKKFDVNVNSSKFNYQQSVTIPAESFRYTLLSSPTIRSVSTEKVKFISEFYLKDEAGSYYNFGICSTNSSGMVNGPLISKINPVFNSLKTTAIYENGSIFFSGETSGNFSFKLPSVNSNNTRDFIFLRNRNEYGSILTENLTISKINNFSIYSSNWYSGVFVESGRLGVLINEVFDNNLFNYIDKSVLVFYQHEPKFKISY